MVYAVSSQINPHNGKVCGLIRFGGDIPFGSFDVFEPNPNWGVSPAEPAGTWVRYETSYRDPVDKQVKRFLPQRGFNVADPAGTDELTLKSGQKLSAVIRENGINITRDARLSVGKISEATNMACLYLERLGL